MKPIESYSLDDPIFLTEQDPATKELGGWLYSDGVFLGVYRQLFDASKPSEEFLEAYAEHYEEDEEPSDEDIEERGKRIEAIRSGSPLTEEEVSFHDSWAEELNFDFDPIKPCPHFYEESENSGRFWVAVTSYNGPAELVAGPYFSFEVGCMASWERILSEEYLNWPFVKDGGYDVPKPPRP